MLSKSVKNLPDQLLLSIIVILLLIVTVSPPLFVITDVHWLGSEAAYSFWAFNGAQWGADIIQNIGPLGFMHFPLSYTGFDGTAKFIANIILSSSLVWLVIYIYSCFKRPLVGASFLGLFIFLQLSKDPGDSNFFGFNIYNAPTEVAHYLIVFFSTYVLFRTNSFLIVCLIGLLLSAMALGKGMFLFLSGFAVIVSVAFLLLQKKYALVTYLGLSVFLSTALLWIASGQEIQNYHTFLISSFHFSSGYSEGLSRFLGVPLHLKLAPICILLFASVFKVFLNWTKLLKNNISLILLMFFEWLFAFMAYKHGIIAEDSYHIQVYLICIIIGFLPCFFIHPSFFEAGETEFQRKFDYSSKLNGLFFLQKLNYSKLSKAFNRSALLFFMLWMVASPILRKHLELISDGGASFQARYQNALQTSKDEMYLKTIKNVVGNEPITYYGELLAPVIYSELNYISSPATISFVGWNRYLSDRQLAFFSNTDKSPKYLIMQMENVRGEIATQFFPLDSLRTQIEIWRNYEPFLVAEYPLIDNRRLLMKRRELDILDLEFNDLKETSATIGQWVEVDEIKPNPLMVKINLDKVFFAQLINLLYKPPSYFIEFEVDDGMIFKHRFTPFKGREGLLISPFISNNSDLVSAFSRDEWDKFSNNHNSNGTLQRIVRFRIICETDFLSSLSCSEGMNLRFKEIKGIPFGSSKLKNKEH